MGTAAGKPEKPASRSEDAGAKVNRDTDSVLGRKSSSSAEVNRDTDSVLGRKSSSSAEVNRDTDSVLGRKSSSSAEVNRDTDSVLGRKSSSSAEVNRDTDSVLGRKSSSSAEVNRDTDSVLGRKSSSTAEVNRDTDSVPGRKSSSTAEVNKNADSVLGRKSLKPSNKGSDKMLDLYAAGSEEVFDWFCQPCDTVGQHVEAMGFCNDCAEYLCKTCYSSHRKPKPSRDHLLLLLDKNQMPKSKTPSSISPPSTQPRQDNGNMSKSNQRIPEAFQSSTKPRRHPGALRASLVGSINVKADNDKKNCRITGCVILGTGNLVVVDRENRKVKLIDVTRGKVISVADLSEGPKDLTEAGSGLVAITLRYSIQLMSVVSSTLTRLRKLKVNGNGVCGGIVYNKGRLIVSLYNPGRVKVIDMQGVVLRTIRKYTNGVRLISDVPWYLAISPDGATLYISDSLNDTVISMTTDGQVKAKYTDDQLRYPTGLTVAPVGTVYVCGCLSKNIHQLTADLTKIQVIQSEEDGSDWPRSICYSDQDSKLYVGSSGHMEHTNSIQAFHLQ